MPDREFWESYYAARAVPALLNDKLAPACTLTPIELQHLVFDYLTYHCHVETARRFAIEAFSFEADDVPSQLLRYRLRQRAAIAQQEAEDDTDMLADDGYGPDEQADYIRYINNDKLAKTLDFAVKRDSIYSAIVSGDISQAMRIVQIYFPNVFLKPSCGTRIDGIVEAILAKAKQPPSLTPSNVEAADKRMPFTSTSSLYVSPRDAAQYHPPVDMSSNISHNPMRILHLDLMIQEFIEAVREAASSLSNSTTSSLSPPTSNHLSPTEAMTTTSASSAGSTASAVAFSPALTQAQTLFSIASKLTDLRQKTLYQDELRDISALFLYPNPETSPVKHFLAQERRDELADRLDQECLSSIGSLAQPAIEQIARNTTAVWNHLAELKTAMPGAVAAAESKEAIDNKPPRVKGFTLQQYLDDGPMTVA